MRESASVAEITAYQEQGFVVVEDLLDADELALWREVVDEAVEERRNLFAPGFPETVDDPAREKTYYERVFTQRVNLWQTNERMKALVLDERIGRIATELAGVDGLRLYHDQALIKEPWGNPTAFHLDVPYWAFSSPDAISIWIALDDATLQNGCLLFVPGSHKAERFDNVGIGPSLGGLFDVYPEFAEVTPVAAPMRAGSCSFHNGLTAHGAGANMTPGRRRAMTAGFMPVGSVFNGGRSIYRDEQLARMVVGEELADDEQNPVVHRRTPSAVG